MTKYKKVQAYLKNEDESLMTWRDVPESFDTQRIINHLRDIARIRELNIMWIKVSGKKILDNTGKSRKTNK